VSFPGAVLITKNSHFNFDFIRGRVFTPDNNPAYGISKISENDFSPLIEAAKKEKGFTKNIKINEITVGYNIREIKEKLNEVIHGFHEGMYNKLIIIGANNYNIPQNGYFEELFDNLKDECFVLSFSYNNNKKNIWHINTFYNISLIYTILEELKQHKDILEKNTIAFITQCHLQTISHAFNLKILGINNIFITECCPNVINPSIFSGMKDIFGIKKISKDPKEDLKGLEILKEE
jgi:hydroxylamine reductase (hybrid-cluster protein)